MLMALIEWSIRLIPVITSKLQTPTCSLSRDQSRAQTKEPLKFRSSRRITTETPTMMTFTRSRLMKWVFASLWLFRVSSCATPPWRLSN